MLTPTTMQYRGRVGQAVASASRAAGTPEVMSGWARTTPKAACIRAFETRLFDSSRPALPLPGSGSWYRGSGAPSTPAASE